MATFKNLKAAGLPKISAKFAKFAAPFKSPSISIKQPKIPSEKTPASFNFAKFSKIAKLPKAPKVAVLKMAIKKAQKVRY